MELFLNYKPSTGRGEPSTWIAGQTGKSVGAAATRVNKYLPHNLSHRWQWRESSGERDALSHIEFLLTWGHLCKRRKTSVKVINFPLYPFLDGGSSFKDPGRILRYLITKTLERS
jgi:hypothetical protein